MKSQEEKSKKTLPIQIKLDIFDGMIYVCPHCHRYVTAESGTKICRKCGGKVDNDNRTQYAGPVKFDGKESWEK